MCTVNRKPRRNSVQEETTSTVKRNLNDSKIHSTHEFVNLITHTTCIALCVTEAEFWSTSSMLEEAVYELERRFTKFVEITQIKSYYAVQGHSRSPILVPIESSYTISY